MGCFLELLPGYSLREDSYRECGPASSPFGFGNPLLVLSSISKTKKHPQGVLFGAATRIRTGDLILTKDVLYQLSHSSVYHEDVSP